MGVFKSVLGSGGLAIDLGTANTLIYAEGTGLVCNEPSVLAFESKSDGSRKVLAVGTDAKKMIGRAHGSMTVTRPLRDGVIADFEGTEAMLRHLIGKFCKRRVLGYQRIVVCIPCGMTALEKRALRELVEAVGATREAYLVEEPLAAAFGAGLPVVQPAGSMIVDIGGGTSDVAVLSCCGIVYSHSLRIAGDKMDEAIIQRIKRDHNLQIGEQTAELVKITLGSAYGDDEIRMLQLRGRDLETRSPRTVEISDEEIRGALVGPLRELVNSVRVALDNIPPEVAADLVETGIVLTGGGALLRHLDTMLKKEIGLPVKIADDPLKAVVMGASKLLQEPSMLREVALN